MARLVVFLRAINVGGHNVKMDDLRALIAGYGFEGVETFIASGNLILDGGRRKAATVEKKLEAGLEADLGYAVASFARTPAELAKAVSAKPFSGAAGRYYVTFLKDPPPQMRPNGCWAWAARPRNSRWSTGNCTGWCTRVSKPS